MNKLECKVVRIVDQDGVRLSSHLQLERESTSGKTKKSFIITFEELWDLHERFPEIVE